MVLVIFYQWPFGTNQWPIMALHVTLVFICVILIIFLLYKSQKFKWWVLVVIGILVILIILLAPEVILVYYCCTPTFDQIIITILFFIELAICVTITVYLIQLRNERLRKRYREQIADQR